MMNPILERIKQITIEDTPAIKRKSKVVLLLGLIFISDNGDCNFVAEFSVVTVNGAPRITRKNFMKKQHIFVYTYY